MALVSLGAEKRNAMQPLTPDDLLIRTSVEDHENGSESASTPPVALERFQTLERLIREIPLTVEPYIELATIYMDANRWADAKRVLDSALVRFPEDEDANYLAEEAQIARSVQLTGEAQGLHDSEPTKLTEKALRRCLLELNVLREKVYRNRLHRHPDQIGLNIPLAIALENLGQRSDAIDCLQCAVDDPQLRAEAAYHLGQLYERASAIPKALSAYRRSAMFRVPTPSLEMRLRALAAAANLAQKSNMIDSARRYVEMLVEIQPQNKVLKQRLEDLNDTPL